MPPKHQPKPVPKVVTIRMSEPLHAALIELGHEERMSVQQLVTRWIEHGVAKNSKASEVHARVS